MKKKLLINLLLITLFIIPLMIGCNGEESTPATTSEPTTAPTASTATPAGEQAWWDKFGEPEYGGEMVVHVSGFEYNFDPILWAGGWLGHWEGLFYRDWTVDRSEEAFAAEFVNVEYYTGGLAESWEYKDPTTVTVNIQQGVKWQDKEPLNGRELTADDVQFTYDRILGTGSGFTEPSAAYGMSIPNVERVVAKDKYTLEFQLKTDSAFAIYDVFDGGFFNIAIVAPEWVALSEEDRNDWHNAVGTGPWLLTDYSSGNSLTYTRNPDYWGVDERHPENQIPYLDEVREIVILDAATAQAALRTGQVDVSEQMNAISWQQQQIMAESDPDIQWGWWPTPGYTIDLRVDHEPFNDIRVRQALQLALPLDVIAETHFGGTVSGQPEGLIYPKLTGWTLPYEEWPADLQAEYSYNPEKAMELLAEAGFPDGFETHIVSATYRQDIELLEIIKAYFLDIGVDMEIEMMDFATWRAFTDEGKHDQMSYSASAGMAKSPATCLRYNEGGNTVSNATYCDDPEYNSLLEQCLSATSIDEAQRLSVECEMYSLSQHWRVNTYGTVSPVAWQPWVKGNSGEWSFAAFPPHYYARWWIDENLK